jgi:aldehyde dehydrogenase (NAD+)
MEFLKTLGINAHQAGCATGSAWHDTTGESIEVTSPADGAQIGTVQQAAESEYETVLKTAREAFLHWRSLPAPHRGEIVRQIGLRVRDYKEPLGSLIAYEMGKPLEEALGEVQEMIDICDFAAGLSRMLSGSTLYSERPRHRFYEQYHPLGIVGIITAFNFPVAVWAWNAVIAAVCGDVTVWKPSSKAPLSAIAAQKILGPVLTENDLPEGIFSLVVGRGSVIGEAMLQDPRISLISFTGSVPAGRHAAEVVARRLGKTLLELGGNNAIIVTEHANLELAVPAIVFGAVGTSGQRCTTTRRLIIHDAIYDRVKEALQKAYQTVRIGSPLDPRNHMGPLVDREAASAFTRALDVCRQQGGRVLCGGTVLTGKGYESGCYVSPAVVEARNDTPIVQEETFAPILYLIRYAGELSEAIALQNGVRQGLSSAIFTDNVREAEAFLSQEGSDCGIANVNIGTSGAEIGGAFGGEKETGGGREAGSDAWKAYMRRQTVTINYGTELPLAQGIRFDI